MSKSTKKQEKRIILLLGALLTTLLIFCLAIFLIFTQLTSNTNTAPLKPKAMSTTTNSNDIAMKIKAENDKKRVEEKNRELNPPPPANPEEKIVVLTFDDGPSMYTDRLVEILDKYGVKATFFVLGVQVEKYPEKVQMVLDHGHEVGNHSYNHSDLTTLDGQDLVFQYQRTQDLVKQATGYDMKLFRPPYGAIDDEVKATIPAHLALWNNDSRDWSLKDRNLIKNEVLGYLLPQNVILTHDIYEESVESMDMIIPELQKQGYKFMTLSEYYEWRGI